MPYASRETEESIWRGDMLRVSATIFLSRAVLFSRRISSLISRKLTAEGGGVVTSCCVIPEDAFVWSRTWECVVGRAWF